MKMLTHNESLPFIKKDWQGNAITHNGRYTNLEGDDLKSFKDVFNWKVKQKNPYANDKQRQQSTLAVTKTENLNEEKHVNSIIPLGHAGFLIDVNDTRIVIDPVLSNSKVLKRYTEQPFFAHEITHIDYILLSHNHRDHIDKDTIKSLTKHNENCKILTGLGIEKVLRRWGVGNEIQEAGWYQRYHTYDSIQIDFLPSRHWSRRWLTDTNINLWGSFALTMPTENKTIYYASDSGYASHFKEIGSMYDISTAMIGIGAFEPMWFMQPYHTGPEEALMVFSDLRADSMMPMHYGTFDLSDEPVNYPGELLKRIIFENNLEVNVKWVEIGKRMGI
jgi:L-ascorbate metabolism protein UlaG (beta-lactamase superfamily)